MAFNYASTSQTAWHLMDRSRELPRLNLWNLCLQALCAEPPKLHTNTVNNIAVFGFRLICFSFGLVFLLFHFLYLAFKCNL